MAHVLDEFNDRDHVPGRGLLSDIKLKDYSGGSRAGGPAGFTKVP